MTEQIKSEIKYKLKVPFEYSSGGSQKNAKELIIKAPNNEIEDELIIIDEFLGKVDNKGQELIFSKLDIEKIQEYQDKFEKMKLQKQSEKQNITEEEKIKQTISSLRTVEGLKSCLSAFSKILQKTCKVDGLEKFTDYMYTQMNPTDTKYLLGKYIVNFIGASQLD